MKAMCTEPHGPHSTDLVALRVATPHRIGAVADCLHVATDRSVDGLRKGADRGRWGILGNQLHLASATQRIADRVRAQGMSVRQIADQVGKIGRNIWPAIRYIDESGVDQA